MSEFGVLVKIDVLPGKMDELRSHFKDFHQYVLQEHGLVYRKAMLDADDPLRIVIFELWQSQQDFENHLASEHCKKFVEVIRGTYGPDGFIKSLIPFF